MKINNIIFKIILSFYPDTQAIYIFGSYKTEYFRKDSDLDIAVLLPVETAKKAGNIGMSECWQMLISKSNRGIDFINLRNSNTVFKHEIIQTSKLLKVFDKYETDVFEMETMSEYQKLNEERSGIINEIIRTGRILNI
jgi:predicted nucleotidyltransferase